MSVLTLACNNVIAQTIESITEQQKLFKEGPQIIVGSLPNGIAVNVITNKIYVTNLLSGTVSVINSNSGSEVKNIPVGTSPSFVAVDQLHNKIYVANGDSNTVSVIDGSNDTEIGQIAVGKHPTSITLDVSHNKIFVSNRDNTVSVINASNDKQKPHNVAVGKGPTYMAVDEIRGKIYVSNTYNNTVSVIDGSNDTEIGQIAVGKHPTSIDVLTLNDLYLSNPFANYIIKEEGQAGPLSGGGKIYVSNPVNKSISVIDPYSDMKDPHDIAVGHAPIYMAFNSATMMVYVVNHYSNTVSVIDGLSDKVAAGITLNIHPGNSGTIVCSDSLRGEKEYPTNIYLYVDAGTNCIAQPNKDFQFIGWVENLNRNSTIPLSDTSANLPVNRYGIFTANFEPLPPAIPPAFLFLLVSIILSSLFGWSIPSIMGWVKQRTQRKYLKECMNQIGRLDRNAIEEMTTVYYVDGKISESHRQLLKDKISELYNNLSGSNGSPIK